MDTIDVRLQGIEESIRTITKYFKTEIDGLRTQGTTQQQSAVDTLTMRELKRNFESLKTDINSTNMNIQMLKKTIKLQQEEHETEQHEKRQDHEVELLHKRLDELRQILNHETTLREQLEHNLQQTQDQLVALYEPQKKETKEMEQDEEIEELDVDLQSQTKHIQDLRSEIDVELVALRKSIQDIKNTMNYVKTSNASQEKDMSTFVKNSLETMNGKLQTFEKGLEKLQNLEQYVPEQLKTEMKKGIADAVREDMRFEIAKIVNEQIHDFSKTLDKRLPELITKDDFYRVVKSIDEDVKAIEAPNMAGFTRRMELVEQHVGQITTMLQNIANRLPVFVE